MGIVEEQVARQLDSREDFEPQDYYFDESLAPLADSVIDQLPYFLNNPNVLLEVRAALTGEPN